MAEKTTTTTTTTALKNEESIWAKIWAKIVEAAKSWWEANKKKVTEILKELLKAIIEKIKELFGK